MLYTKELAIELKEQLENISLKIEDDKDFAFDVIATTADVDRDNETIKINAWDTKNWEKNPVILANHHYTIENIIGKGLKFYTSNGKKRLKGVFSKSNPLGILAKNLYNEGMLKSVSVGFIPLKRNENDFKIIEKAELLEVSFVAVPCNPNATSLDGKLYDEAIAKGFLIEETKEVKEVVEEENIETPATIESLSKELNEIKTILKTLVDDKIKDEDKEKEKVEVEKALEKKELLQTINKATATALENLKKL